jgi:hypothetical protein
MEVLIRIRNRRTNYFEHYELRGTHSHWDLEIKYITTQIGFSESILFNVGRTDNDNKPPYIHRQDWLSLCFGN